MKKALGLGLLTLFFSSTLLAAPAATEPKKSGAQKAPAEAPEKTAPAAQTIDIIGTQEAPGVFNVVPWKDKASRLPKKEVTASVLRETLQPLDPEVLRREIELQKRLSEQ
jgi:hypothetical protein